MSEDKERQEDEIGALQSIYESDLVMSTEHKNSGLLLISPNIIGDHLDLIVTTIVNEQPVEKTMKLQYLLPIELYFSLPDDYPSSSQPLYMIKCCWLNTTQLSQLCSELDEIWDRQKAEILYDWAFFLKEDCLSFLKTDKLRITSNANLENCPSSTTTNNLLEKPKEYLRLRALDNRSSNEKIKKKIKSRRSRLKKVDQRFTYTTPIDEQRCSTEVPTPIPEITDKEINQSENKKKFASNRTVELEFILSNMETYGKRSTRLTSELDIRVLSSLTSNVDDMLFNRLMEYNDKYLNKIFRSDWHLCGICIDTKIGSESTCMRPCGHTFCIECMQQYLNMNISIANVLTLSCPSTDCDTRFSSDQIQQLVTEELFEKYQKFMKEKAVEKDPTLVFCPRQICHSVAKHQTELSFGLCYCPKCSFYFCLFCKKTYHGVQPCQLKINQVRSVIEEYQNADPYQKRMLELRYSKKQIDLWVS